MFTQDLAWERYWLEKKRCWGHIINFITTRNVLGHELLTAGATLILYTSECGYIRTFKHALHDTTIYTNTARSVAVLSARMLQAQLHVGSQNAASQRCYSVLCSRAA